MKTLIAFAAVILFCSCGPSEEEIKLRFEHIASLKDSITHTTADISTLKSKVSQFHADLEVAKDQMASIKEWKLLRTREEREQQITNQSIKISGIEEEITKIQSDLEAYQLELDFMQHRLIVLQSE